MIPHKTIRRSGSGSSTSTSLKIGNTTTTTTINSKGKITTTKSIRDGNTTYSNSYSTGGAKSTPSKHNWPKKLTTSTSRPNNTYKNIESRKENYRSNTGDEINLSGSAIKGLILIVLIFYAGIILLMAAYLATLLINTPGIAIVTFSNNLLNIKLDTGTSWAASLAISFIIFFSLVFYSKKISIKPYWVYIIYLLICTLISTASYYAKFNNSNNSIATTIINEWSYGKFEKLKNYIIPQKP